MGRFDNFQAAYGVFNDQVRPAGYYAWIAWFLWNILYNLPYFLITLISGTELEFISASFP